MPEPGGAAAIYGILYQILANLWRVSEIRLEAKLAGQEIRSARLILEPKGGGGDTRYEGNGIRVVEQYKTRGGNRTWSLNDLIDSVFPDLFIAVDPARLTELCTYRFVTDGRCGHIGHFQRFLHNFRSVPAPEDLLDRLDDAEKYRFLGRGTLTERALFLHMAHRVRSKGDKTEDTLHYRKLWHLLAGLKISDMKRSTDLTQTIDEFLIQVVARGEEVEAKRQQLCGILIERAAQGSYRCTPEEILGAAQLNATLLSELGTLKARLRELAEERFRDGQYDRGRDVRGIPPWPNECSVLVFTGESGQGKTWQLFRLADDILASGGSVVVVPATGEADNDLQQASDVLWLDGLNQDEPLKINRLTARYQRIHRRPSEDWLTICIDDLQEIKEVKHLLMQPWKRWGIRLALTVPAKVGEAITNRELEGVHVHKVPDFAPSEARDCLERRGYDWGEIQDDVRDTLRRPSLAGLYCSVASGGGWAPQNEYDIYASHWRDLTDKREQLHHPSDRSIILQLAASITKEKAQYPWPQDFWRECGLSDKALLRLESIGWLRRGRRGDVEIWHDRLLNWAIAEWLIDQRRTHQPEKSKLAELLCRMYQNRPEFAGKRLGYVPMDYLWLASDPKNGLGEDVPFLLNALETDSSHGGNPENLYTVLVPTLGEWGYPALVERLQASTLRPDEQHFIPRLIGQAIVKIGERSPEFARSRALDLIHKKEFVFRAAGLHILKELPDSRAVDPLWTLHRQHFQALSGSSSIEGHLRCDLSFSALRACVQLTPQWLAEKIRDAVLAVDPVSELAWLLWDLKRPEANDLWYQLKTILFEKVTPDKPSGAPQRL
jgi:hypothetical protein